MSMTKLVPPTDYTWISGPVGQTGPARAALLDGESHVQFMGRKWNIRIVKDLVPDDTVYFFGPSMPKESNMAELTASAPSDACAHCGCLHRGLCPFVKSVEYYESGRLRKVEFHARNIDMLLLPAVAPNSGPLPKSHCD